MNMVDRKFLLASVFSLTVVLVSVVFSPFLSIADTSIYDTDGNREYNVSDNGNIYRPDGERVGKIDGNNVYSPDGKRIGTIHGDSYYSPDGKRIYNKSGDSVYTPDGERKYNLKRK